MNKDEFRHKLLGKPVYCKEGILPPYKNGIPPAHTHDDFHKFPRVLPTMPVNHVTCPPGYEFMDHVNGNISGDYDVIHTELSQSILQRVTDRYRVSLSTVRRLLCKVERFEPAQRTFYSMSKTYALLLTVIREIDEICPTGKLFFDYIIELFPEDLKLRELAIQKENELRGGLELSYLFHMIYNAIFEYEAAIRRRVFDNIIVGYPAASGRFGLGGKGFRKKKRTIIPIFSKITTQVDKGRELSLLPSEEHVAVICTEAMSLCNDSSGLPTRLVSSQKCRVEVSSHPPVRSDSRPTSLVCDTWSERKDDSVISSEEQEHSESKAVIRIKNESERKRKNLDHTYSLPESYIRSNVKSELESFTSVQCHVATVEVKEDDADLADGSDMEWIHTYSINDIHQQRMTMMTVRAQIHNHTTSLPQDIMLVLDSGSQKTFISEPVADLLGLSSGQAETMLVTGFGDCTKAVSTRACECKLYNVQGDVLSITAYTHPTITGVYEIPATKVCDREFIDQLGIECNHLTSKDAKVRPAILVGLDFLWKVLAANKQQYLLPSGLIASPSHFGYILSGVNTPDPWFNSDAPIYVNAAFLHDESNFWSLEALGITDNPCVESDRELREKVIRDFNESVVMIDNIIHVRLPWNGREMDLLDNKKLAYKRLVSQSAHLAKTPGVWDLYHKTFTDQLTAGIIEVVDDTVPTTNVVYYIPHQSVFKTTSVNTKLRVVYDASSSKGNTPSLNDCVEAGPAIIPHLGAVLLRARTVKYLITADVEKAFHQVYLQESQKDATRFLWVRDPSKPVSLDNIICYRFKRVPFGVAASPFLLAMAILYQLQLTENDPDLKRDIKRNLYVDNVILSADTATEIIEKYHKSKSIFAHMNMNLREFSTNHPTALKDVCVEDKIVTEVTNLLGLSWNTTNDTLMVKSPSLEESQGVLTKRKISSKIAQTFDPLGLLAPSVVKPKVFLQSLWKKDYDWDSELSAEDCDTWEEISKDMMQNIEIRRMATHHTATAKHTLVIFADASQTAYGTNAYVRTEDGDNVTCNLIMAKTRVTPISQKVTIPRLELIAAYIAVNMASYIIEHMDIPITSISFFSDSQVILHWIHSGRKMRTFVSNKVRTIRNKLENLSKEGITSRFHYVNTTDNPADLSSRGESAHMLSNNSLWWHGPGWLIEPPGKWPFAELLTFDMPSNQLLIDEVLEECAVNSTIITSETICALVKVAENTRSSVIPFARSNNLIRLKRCMARVMKFIKMRIYARISKSKQTILLDAIPSLALFTVEPKIVAQDMIGAEALMIVAQYKDFGSEAIQAVVTPELNVHKDEYGVLRCVGRLQHADVPDGTEKPALLFPNHPLTVAIIRHCHRDVLHGGTDSTLTEFRRKYWVKRARRQVLHFTRNCVPCRKQNAHPFRYPETTPLPVERVQRSSPFAHSGLDYFGPLYVKSEVTGEEKMWVALFTCLSTRAVHLEVVPDNTTFAFLCAFKRFVSRRGIPVSIFSDNAQTFLSGEKAISITLSEHMSHTDFHDFMANQTITWRHITPLSPWKGGVYERMVQSVKRCVRKSIGMRKISSMDMMTLLVEVEGVINSRPLTHSNCDFMNTPPLRPIDFLIPNSIITLPSRPPSDEFLPAINTQEKALALLDETTGILDKFWTRWQVEYVSLLREQHKERYMQGAHSALLPRVGEVVLLTEENLPRYQWGMALITKLHAGTDGVVRAVDIRTSNGKILRRSVNTLVPLELNSPEEMQALAEQDLDIVHPPADLNDDANKKDQPAGRVRLPREAKKQLVYGQ